MALAPPSSGAPTLVRAMRNVVEDARAPGGTDSFTPSGPLTTPPAPSSVATASIGTVASSLPPHALNAVTTVIHSTRRIQLPAIAFSPGHCPDMEHWMDL